MVLTIRQPRVVDICGRRVAPIAEEEQFSVTNGELITCARVPSPVEDLEASQHPMDFRREPRPAMLGWLPSYATVDAQARRIELASR
jgi:hypothetical protein